MDVYPKINLGEYRGSRINEIPMSYLVWLFPTLTRNQSDQKLYYAILYFFLLRDVRVEERDNKAYFYFNDYEYIRPPGVDNSFLISDWIGIDSNNNKVYEIKFFDTNFYIVKQNTRFVISNKYISHRYLYGGITMVYETNEEYFFSDPFGNIIGGAYLMRKPYILDGDLKNKFSDNMKYE